MKMMIHFSLAALTALAAIAEPVFWNRDGTGDFAAAQPPVAFDGLAGKGVRWKTKLPNWSNSSPIVVETGKGARVILLAEPWDGYSPWLLCLDAASGEELWRRELDPTPLLPKEQQAEARALAGKVWDALRLRRRLTAELQAVYAKDRAGFSGDKVPPEAEAIVAQAKAAGFNYCGIGQSAGGYPNHLSIQSTPIQKELQKLTGFGLMPSEWEYQGTWDGVAYPTPVSDGQRIWTVTMHNLYSCHDLAGNVLWQVRFPPANEKDLSPEQKQALTGADGKLRWPGGWPGQGGFSTSPLLVDGKLVSCAGMMVRCLDAATGKVLWAQPLRGVIGQALGVPGIATVGGEKYVVSVDNERRTTTTVPVYRLRDGALAAELPGVTCSKAGVSGPVIDGDLIVNQPGHEEGALTAYRLQVKGAGLEVVEAWKLPKSTKREEAISLFRPAWRAGRLYNGGAVLDLRAGKWVSAQRGVVNPGYYGQGGILVGPVVLSWDFYGGTRSSDKTTPPDQARFAWTSIETGKLVGQGTLPINPADGHTLEFKRAQACRDSWRWLGAATPFAHKDRLYIRAYDFLWCIGDK
jgi:outer membrane protein assembly factor BamB